MWTLLAASFSADPLTSHDDAKKLVLFVLFYIALDILGSDAARERTIDAALLGGLVLGLGCLFQHFFLGFDTLMRRPSSFLGHYMTASGLLMAALILAAARLTTREGPLRRPQRTDLLGLAVVVLAVAGMTFLQRLDVLGAEAERVVVASLGGAGAFFVLSRGRWPGPATSGTLAVVVAFVCTWAMLVSRTRNAWLGALAGLAVLALLKTPRSLFWLAGGIGLLVLVFRPQAVVSRLTVTDASSRDRIYMWQAGADMLREKPIFGVGPGMILKSYPEYRWRGAPNAQAPHLHNNALQIAAERGLPCLAWWLWWMAVAMADAYRAARAGGSGAVWGASALAFLVAIMVAGLFEYNFGDSEILMLTLVVTALPYTLRGTAAERRPAAA